ncbi:MAG: hypothetical protein KJ732_01525 [Candidatus Margulisbacteria bacterium]|nr:hypothetical protein [Candidatus Margulisiibacteriota bacterium]
MKDHLWIKILFAYVGVVEFAVGLPFLLLPGPVFSLAGIPLIDRLEFVQFPALLIMVFGLMMLNIARDPVRHQQLIIYCCLFKAAFIYVVVFNWLTKGLPLLWLLFASLDAIYLIGFIIAYLKLKQPSST